MQAARLGVGLVMLECSTGMPFQLLCVVFRNSLIKTALPTIVDVPHPPSKVTREKPSTQEKEKPPKKKKRKFDSIATGLSILYNQHYNQFYLLE